MHQDEERLPLACLPGAIASQPPMNGDGVAPYEPDFFSSATFPPPDSASTSTSGAVGVSGDCRYGISPALKLRLQRSPSFRRWHPSSCTRALSIHKSGQSPASPFTHIALFIMCSIHLLILSHILSLVYFPLSIAAGTLPRCASLHPWMRLHGWRLLLLS